MNHQQFIIDNGLFNNKKLRNIVGYSFETLESLLRTIKEYRDFAHPSSHSWEEYVLEIFHIFEFSTQSTDHQVIILSDMKGEGSPLAILYFVQPENETNEFYNSKWIDIFPDTFDKNYADWGIITDGYSIKIHDLSLNDPKNKFLLINIESILREERTDSFLTMMGIFEFIRTKEDINKKHISEIDFSKYKKFDTYTGSTNRIVSRYITLIKNLKVQKNRNYWLQETKFAAPHKPLLLLALLITNRKQKIDPVNMYKGLRSISVNFEILWDLIYPDKNNPGIASPFLRMNGEYFWKILPCVDGRLHDNSSIDDLLELIYKVELNKEFFNLIIKNDSWIALFNTILDKFFDLSIHDKIIKFFVSIFDDFKFPPEFWKEFNLNNEDEDDYRTGYIELSSHPNVPPQKIPTKRDCQGYEYISMVQLCNIAEKFNRTRGSACRAFGGDNGELPVIPSRQAQVSYGHKPWKFVLVAAVEKYFEEEGIDW